MRGAQLLELAVRRDGRMLRPRDVVLDGANRALRAFDLDDLAQSGHREQTGEAAEGTADAQEAGPERQIGAFGDPQRAGDREEKEREQPDEPGAAEEAGTDPGSLDLRGDLGLGQLHLFVDQQGQVSGRGGDQLTERLLVDVGFAACHRQLPRALGITIGARTRRRGSPSDCGPHANGAPAGAPFTGTVPG